MRNPSKNSRKLTQAAIDKFKAPTSGRIVYWDQYLPGFGLRITENNARSWVATYRVNRKFVWETIASIEKMPNLADAREAARNSMLKAITGINPVAERRHRNQHEAARAEDAATRTVAYVVEQYLRKVETNQRPR